GDNGKAFSIQMSNYTGGQAPDPLVSARICVIDCISHATLGVCEMNVKVAQSLRCAVVSPDDRWFYGIFGRKLIRFELLGRFDSQLDVLGELAFCEGFAGGVLQFGPNGKQMLASFDTGCVLFDVASGAKLATYKLPIWNWGRPCFIDSSGKVK